MSDSTLARIRVVLVEPSHPGNVGAAARAMKTMGLTRLWLVRPRQFPSAEATARASGADDVLYHARVVETLEQALVGCGLVAGTSARDRRLPWPMASAAECARRALTAPLGVEIALVFGREHSGLTNAELDRCHFLVRIPANPDYSSLNLAAAVQIVAYEIYKGLVAAEGNASLGRSPRSGAAGAALSGIAAGPVSREPGASGQPGHVPASAAELEGLFQHLEQVAVATGFLDPEKPRRLIRRLRRLILRAQPDRVEVNILRGLIRAVRDTLAGRNSPV